MNKPKPKKLIFYSYDHNTGTFHITSGVLATMLELVRDAERTKK